MCTPGISDYIVVLVYYNMIHYQSANQDQRNQNGTCDLGVV